MRVPIAACVAMLLLLLSGCTSSGGDTHSAPSVVIVPTDAATITQAVAMVAQGGLVLVKAGVYRESVTIATAGVTLRGLDRNKVIIDGEGFRPEGIVVVANGVRVENLTVRSHTFNGVLVTGLHDGTKAQAHGLDGYQKLDPHKYPPIDRFSISHVTSYNNGLYGIYAFDSQHGSITDSYASGSADSGFYVGQCEHCDIVVRGNTAENNAVGLENANASDPLYIVGNRWSNNRVGMTLISSYQEAFVPQRSDTVVGNLVSDNTSATSPAQADGAFGIGLGISGGQSNKLERNTIAGNPRAGVLVSNSEDLPARDNLFSGTLFADNGVDLANISQPRAAAIGNCLATGDAGTTSPASFARGDCSAAEQAAAGLPGITVPPGISFLKVPAPPTQPQLPGDLTAVPDRLPDTVGTPSDLESVLAPARDWRPGS